MVSSTFFVSFYILYSRHTDDSLLSLSLYIIIYLPVLGCALTTLTGAQTYKRSFAEKTLSLMQNHLTLNKC